MRPEPAALSFAFYDTRREPAKLLLSGSFARIGTGAAYFSIDDEDHYSEAVHAPDHRAALRLLIDHLHRNSHIDALLDIHAVVYRIGHGGDLFDRTTVFTAESARPLERVAHLSPAGHAAATLVRAGLSQLPSASHVGVFDTAAGARMPPEHAWYALDPALVRKFGLRRYAFQGIMHTGAYRSLRDPGRQVISVVIDDDVSVAGFRDGTLIDTTTGFTQAEGIPGLHRSGSLDPRIPLYLAAHLHASPRQIDTVLSAKSGIAAVAGKASYAEIVAGCRKRDIKCITALMQLSSRLSYAIAGMSASIGGIDTIVFSGSGASSILIEDICDRLGHLGVELGRSAAKGRARHAVRVLSSKRSRVRVVHADIEEIDVLLAEAKDAIRAHANRMFKNKRLLRH